MSDGKIVSLKGAVKAKSGSKRKSKTHFLKTWPEPYWRTYHGFKLFEFRKNDRDFQLLDYLVLQEYDPKTETYSGHETKYIVLYILKEGFGLPDGYCIMSLKKDML